MKKISVYLNECPVQIKATISFIIASIFSQGLSLLATPIYTRLMNQNEIGIVTTFSSWLSILTVITSFSLYASPYNIALNEFRKERKKVTSSMLSFSSMITFFCFIIYVLFHSFFNEIMNLTTDLVLLMFLYLLLSPALNFWLTRNRYEYNYKGVLFVSIISSFIALFFSISMIICFMNTSISLGRVRLYSYYLIMILTSAFMYYIIMKKGKVFYDKVYWDFSIKIGFPVVIHSLSKQILDISDRLMITNLVGNIQVAIYGTIYNFSMIPIIFWNAINSAIVPYMFENLNNGVKGRKKINELAIKLIILFAMICSILTFLAPDLIKIFTTSEYYEGIYIMPPLFAGIFLTCLYSLFANVLLYHKKTKLVMLATLLSSIVNIFLNLLLIPIFGYMSAAYTTMIAYFILALLQYWMMVHYLKEKFFNIKIIFLITLIFSFICLMANYIYRIDFIRYILIIIIIMVLIMYTYINKNIIIRRK